MNRGLFSNAKLDLCPPEFWNLKAKIGFLDLFTVNTVYFESPKALDWRHCQISGSAEIGSQLTEKQSLQHPLRTTKTDFDIEINKNRYFFDKKKYFIVEYIQISQNKVKKAQ